MWNVLEDCGKISSDKNGKVFQTFSKKVIQKLGSPFSSTSQVKRVSKINQFSTMRLLLLFTLVVALLVVKAQEGTLVQIQMYGRHGMRVPNDGVSSLDVQKFAQLAHFLVWNFLGGRCKKKKKCRKKNVCLDRVRPNFQGNAVKFFAVCSPPLSAGCQNVSFGKNGPSLGIWGFSLFEMASPIGAPPHP